MSCDCSVSGARFAAKLTAIERKSTRKTRFTRRNFLKAAAVACVPGGYAYTRIEPNWLDIHPVELVLPRLSPAFDGYRIAQISDIHMDAWMTRDRLANIVALINDQRPDAVALTGDFVTTAPHRHSADLTAALRAIKARDGAFFVLGNHDHWTRPETMRKALRAAGLVDVCNAVHTLRRSTSSLHICGVDDMWAKAGDIARVRRQLAAEPDAGAAVLLCHEPDFADEFAAHDRFDLQLSGHSHGGQVRLPLYGPPLLPKHGRKYHSGRYDIGTLIVYTNRGVGMLSPRLRLNCRPEITIFTLKSR